METVAVDRQAKNIPSPYPPVGRATPESGAWLESVDNPLISSGKAVGFP